MIGRGILKNPGDWFGRSDKAYRLKKTGSGHFMMNFTEYQEVLFGEKTVLFKMKELWFYMAPLFTQYEKYAKKLKKQKS